jgi:hypothetical protein
MRDPKSMLLVELDRRIDLYHGQGNCFCLIRGVCQQYLKNLRSNALPLHQRRHIERAKVDGRILNLLLNPANILLIGGNNPDFVEFEELSKVFVLALFVPAEQALDDPTHRLEVHFTRESEIPIARRSKSNIQRYFVQPES